MRNVPCTVNLNVGSLLKDARARLFRRSVMVLWKCSEDVNKDEYMDVQEEKVARCT